MQAGLKATESDMSRFPLACSPPALHVLLCQRRRNWLRDMPVLMLHKDIQLQVFDRTPPCVAAATVTRPTGLAVIEIDLHDKLDDIDRHGELQVVHDISRLGWKVVVVGGRPLAAMELPLIASGAVAVVTTVLDLDKVEMAMARLLSNRPQRIRTWRDELFSRLPWKPQFSHPMKGTTSDERTRPDP